MFYIPFSVLDKYRKVDNFMDYEDDPIRKYNGQCRSYVIVTFAIL